MQVTSRLNFLLTTILCFESSVAILHVRSNYAESISFVERISFQHLQEREDASQK